MRISDWSSDVCSSDLGGTGRGVDTWENVQHFALAGEILQGNIGQIASYQGKGWRLGTGLWQLAVDLNRVAFESDLSHERIHSDRFENGEAGVNHEIVLRPMVGQDRKSLG